MLRTSLIRLLTILFSSFVVLLAFSVLQHSHLSSELVFVNIPFSSPFFISSVVLNGVFYTYHADCGCPTVNIQKKKSVLDFCIAREKNIGRARNGRAFRRFLQIWGLFFSSWVY